MHECVKQQPGEIGGPINFLPDSMTKRTIERGNLESILTFRKLIEPMQLGNTGSGLDWVWQRGALEVDELVILWWLKQDLAAPLRKAQGRYTVDSYTVSSCVRIRPPFVFYLLNLHAE